MTVQSNSSVASSATADIRSAATGVSGVATPVKDGVSQYTGNQHATYAIDNETSYSQQLSQKIIDFANLITHTASEFEAMDARLSDGISSIPVGGNGRGKLYQPDFSPNPSLFH